MNKASQFCLLFLCIVLCMHTAYADEEKKELPPLDSKYMGVHGMKLLNKGSNVYASHMLTLKEPNNVQLLYKLDIDQLHLLQFVKDADLVTIKTDSFNLQRLMRGESLEVNADVYMGDYKTDGILTYKQVKIVFDEKLFSKVIDKPDASNKRQTYDVVKVKNNERILIHQVQQAPSYEHIIYLSDNVNCMTSFSASSATPSEKEIYYKLTYCGSIKPLYYSTDSFLQ